MALENVLCDSLKATATHLGSNTGEAPLHDFIVKTDALKELRADIAGDG